MVVFLISPDRGFNMARSPNSRCQQGSGRGANSSSFRQDRLAQCSSSVKSSPFTVPACAHRRQPLVIAVHEHRRHARSVRPAYQDPICFPPPVVGMAAARRYVPAGLLSSRPFSGNKPSLINGPALRLPRQSLQKCSGHFAVNFRQLIGSNVDERGLMIELIGADGGTRTRTPDREADFKSAASTFSPRPLDDDLAFAEAFERFASELLD